MARRCLVARYVTPYRSLRTEKCRAQHCDQTYLVMSNMHYYSHNIADYRKDTLGLTLIEHGAYRQLIDQYYLDEKPLPLDEEILYRLVNARNQDEKYAVRFAIKSFFTKTEDGYVHGRCDAELQKYKSQSEQKSKASRVRWDKERNADALQTESQPITNKPITSKPVVIDTPEGVDPTIWKDFKKLRSAKKAIITETALNGLVREAAKANKPLNDVLRLCVERGWVGFKAEWDSIKDLEGEQPKKWPGK